MDLINLARLAKQLGVSRAAITLAIKKGRCPSVEKGKNKFVDLDDPEVQKFVASVRANKRKVDTAQAAQRTKPDVAPCASPGDPEFDSEVDLKTRKLMASADLETVKAKLKAAEYFEKIGAVVDAETLRQKMGKFTDVLVTDLLYFPEEIADQLWLQAKASNDPPKAIREYVADKLSVVIDNAKRAARDVVPPDSSRVYAVVDSDSVDN